MKPLSSDTSLHMQRVHYELMRAIPGWKRLKLALELTHATRHLVLADLRHRFPKADEKEIRLKFISRVLPRVDVIRAYGFDPEADLTLHGKSVLEKAIDEAN